MGEARILGVEPREAECITDGCLTGTPEHPIFYRGKWMRFDMIYTCESKRKYSTESNSGGTQTHLGPQIETTSNPMLATFRTASNRFIAKCGKLVADQSLKVITSIIGTATQPTTASITWSVSRRLSTFPRMPALGQPISITWPESGLSRWSGIDRKTEELGTENMPKHQWQKRNKCPRNIEPASIAENSMDGRGSAYLPSFAAIIASRLPGVNLVWTMFPGVARFVAASLWRTSTEKSSSVAAPAHAGIRTVYALRTEHGCYVANGRLVSNCDAVRYGCREIFKPWRIES